MELWHLRCRPFKFGVVIKRLFLHFWHSSIHLKDRIINFRNIPGRVCSWNSTKISQWSLENHTHIIYFFTVYGYIKPTLSHQTLQKGWGNRQIIYILFFTCVSMVHTSTPCTAISLNTSQRVEMNKDPLGDRHDTYSTCKYNTRKHHVLLTPNSLQSTWKPS